MKVVALLCILLIALEALFIGAYAHSSKGPNKAGKGKKPKKPRVSTTSIRFGTAFLTETEEARKIAKDLDKNEIEVVGLLGIPSNKLEAYQNELKSRDYMVHKTKDGSILAARGGKVEISEPGILFTSPNGRQIYAATKLGGEIPAAETSMMGQAARRVRGQDADWILFRKSGATDSMGISVADHLASTVKQQGYIMISKERVHCELVDLDLPGPEIKLSQHTPKTGLNMPVWVWILIICLFPAIAGITAIGIIQAKAARRARGIPRTL